jgi:hypothetical protein
LMRAIHNAELALLLPAIAVLTLACLITAS